MPRVFKQQYTRPIPADAMRTTARVKGKEVPAVKFKGSDGKYVVAPLTKNGDRCRVQSPVWYGQFTDADGQLQRVPLCENKAAAEMMLNDKIKEAEQAKALGLSSQTIDARKRPLTEHLDDWEQSLQADVAIGKAKAKHVGETVRNARRVIAGCRFVVPNDLAADAVKRFLADLCQTGRPVTALDPAKTEYTREELAKLLHVKPAAVTSLVKRHRLPGHGNGKARRFPPETAQALHKLRSRGRSLKTMNLHLAAVKQFAAWLVSDKRMAVNPLADLEGGNVELDRRHDRQTLAEEQLAAILNAALNSPKAFRGLTGRDRHHLYLAAMTTGFRVGELAALPPEWFELAAAPPVVVLPATLTKNKKAVRQPLPSDVAETLRLYLAGRQAGQPVWPGNWTDNAADMLRIDLDAAGVPYVVEGPGGPLHADFHSLRHSFISLLDKSGASLKVAMQLARHSDPKLTMARYGRAQLHDLGRAVDRLPTFTGSSAPEAQQARATGTDSSQAPHLHSAYTPLTQTPDGRGGQLRLVDGEGEGSPENETGPEPLISQGFEATSEPVMAVAGSSPSRTRTYNKPVNSRLLYRLSYRGMKTLIPPFFRPFGRC